MKIAEFLKLRKQSDYVKLALVLFIAVTYFIVSGIIGIIGYARFASQRVSYILQPNTTSALSDTKIADLCEMDGVVTASLMRQYPIVISCVSGEKGVAVTGVSPEYLLKCFGIDSGTEGTNTFYINNTAFEMLSGNTESNKLNLSFRDEKDATHTAVFVKVEALPENESLFFHSDSSSELNNNTAINISLMLDSADISGTLESQLSEKGYSVSNQAELQKTGYETDLMLQKLCSNLLCAILAAVGSFAFAKLYKETHE